MTAVQPLLCSCILLILGFRNSTEEPLHMRSMELALFLLVVLCVGTLPMWAQSTATGTVAGTVTDQSGAVVSGATVTLTDVATNTSRTTTTNETGRYIFVNVPPGDYNVSISKTGFATMKAPQVSVKVGTATTVNGTLQVGAATVEVEVKAAGTELQTMNATIGNTVTGIALENLPQLGRNDVSTFVELQPGVSPDGSVAGAVVDQSSFQLDGGNNTNDMDGSMSVYTPSFAGDPTGVASGNQVLVTAPTGVMPTPADSVEEFKVNTANQTADFNSSAGAQVQVVTKRGTNTWHGNAYEYYLDNNFSANTWDNNLSGTKLPSYHYSRFGGSIGGPILPKEILGGKTYLFANYQGFRWNNVQTIERDVPTVGMQLGLLQAKINGVRTVINFNPTPTLYPASAPVIGALVPGTTYAPTACPQNANGLCDPRATLGVAGSGGINPVVQAMWNKYLPASIINDPACTLQVGSRCDTFNVQGFKANLSIPQTDNNGALRLDHDFGSKWHFMSSYRYYHLLRTTNNQVDIGGFFPGDKVGVAASVAHRPQVPWYYVAGLTTNISSNTTNDFHYSFLRNWWAYQSLSDPPQLASLGGALEPLGEQHYNVLSPYNVDNQDTRVRFWDGQDHFLRDDISMLKGNHLLQFGGSYQHNFNWHERSDNGGTINFNAVYQLGDSLGAGLLQGDLSSTYPSGFGSSKTGWGRYVSSILGIVTDSQIAYTRSGANLALNPRGTLAVNRSTIPYYNAYFSDTWHMKPTFTLTYGLGWTLEMPPVEKDGNQVTLVDTTGQQIDAMAYLAQRKKAALAGQVYNPIIGFSLVGNTANGLKYPYNPYYGEFSPRIAVAWNPRFESDSMFGKVFGHDSTVIRGGYGRIYGRLNGVNLVLVPLLAPGLIQPVNCQTALMDGTCAGSPGKFANVFRIGVDGNSAPLGLATPTLPQPYLPGFNNVATSSGESLDPHFRPNVVDSFDLTIQRQLSRNATIEFGYIGRRVTHEYQPLNLNSVPYMMTLGGQNFAQAYANIEWALGCATSASACGAAVPAATIKVNGVTTANPAYAAYINSIASQPFFQAALNSAYCMGNYSGAGGTAYPNCTAAVVDGELGNLTSQSVWSLWSDLDQGGVGGGPNGSTTPGFNFGRTMLNTFVPNTPIAPNGVPFGANGQLSGGIGVNASVGYGNYNAGFVSVKLGDWHGLTAQSNFTYSKALGTGAFVQATSEYTANDVWDLKKMYGPQAFDRKFVYNAFFVYQPPFYKGQQGAIGRLLGGWSFSPIFTTGSGQPLYCNTFTDGQAFGSGDGNTFFSNEQCVFTSKFNGHVSVHRGVAGDTTASVGTSTAGSTPGTELNLFADPNAVYNQVRAPLLGIDTRNSGTGPIHGLAYWNIDMSVRKSIKISERGNLMFQFLFLNVTNHNQLLETQLDISTPATWGVLTQQANTPRQMEFGVKLNF